MAMAIQDLWSLMGAFAFIQTFIPPQLRRFVDDRLEQLWNKFGRFFNRHATVEIPEDVHGSFNENKLYKHAELYLSSLERIKDSDYLRVHRCEHKSRLTFTLPPNETIEDTFNGVLLEWTHHATQKPESNQQNYFWDYGRRRDSRGENRSFTLKLLKSDKNRILTKYLEHVTAVAEEIERKNTQRKLYTNESGCEWDVVDFKHPSTFETLALQPELKEQLKDDLLKFANGESFYHSVGRAWKRGYLLYGPPGTGKSSLIAAMANFLNYDIYDLELTSVHSNSDLKTLLIRTTRKSIIVIEDIDCSLDLSDRTAKAEKKDQLDNKPLNPVEENKQQSKVTLSGLLNFTDGLWSCCGEERIFVFTTNHKDRLDPALLRSGRMDLHILLSYCTFPAFKTLAANYLAVHEHELYPELEKVLKDSKMTPAEVVELLLSNKGNAQMALQKVMDAASSKKKANPNIPLPSLQKVVTPNNTNVDSNKKKTKNIKKYKFLLNLLSKNSLS